MSLEHSPARAAKRARAEVNDPSLTVVEHKQRERAEGLSTKWPMSTFLSDLDTVHFSVAESLGFLIHKTTCASTEHTCS